MDGDLNIGQTQIPQVNFGKSEAMTIKIDMLRCFSAVAEAGHLSDAAARLGRSPSAVSVMLKQLEEHLGAPLFESDRKSRLTPLGAEVFELARAQLAQFDEAVNAMERSARAPGGIVRIAAVPSAAGALFDEVLSYLQSHYPQVQIELRDADSRTVLEALVRGVVDIGVASGRPKLNQIHQEPLFQDKFGMVAHVDHPLMVRTAPLDLRDLANAPCLHNDLARQHGIDPGTRSGATVHNTLSLIALLRTGKWVTVLPESVVRLAPGVLGFRPVAGLSQQREVSLFLNQRAPLPDVVADLANRIRQIQL